MNSRSIGTAKWIAVAWLLVVGGVLALSGCIFSQTAEDVAAKSTRPGAKPSAPVEARELPLPTSAVAGASAAGGLAASSEAPDSYPLPSPVQTGPESAFRPVGRSVVPVSEITFEEKVMRSAVPVLVDFYADWCGPCKTLARTLEELAESSPQGTIVKVNVDDSPKLAARYGLEAVPTLLVFKDGQVIAEQQGVVSKARLRAMLRL